MDIGKEESANNMHDTSLDLHEIGLEDQGQVASGQSSNEQESVHDQLPNVEEYKTSQQTGGSTRMRLKVTLVIASMIVLASILIAVGVVIGRDTAPTEPTYQKFIPDSPEPAPTDVDIVEQPGFISDNPEPAPTGTGTDVDSTNRVYEVVAFITNMGWADPVAINTPNSPQWQAAQWLANDDPMQMTIAIDQEFMNRYLLATFFFALNGRDWFYTMNWLSGKRVCDWNTFFKTKVGMQVQVGVSCHAGESIREIFLPSMGLKGNLPSEIGLLLDLEDINLFGNSIGGVLPEEMKDLREIRTLILHDNDFGGPIPAWITSLPLLTTLNLADNKFDGGLPATMLKLENLQTLILEKNFLTGNLESLMGLAALKSLYLGNNEFTGMLTDDVFISWRVIEVMDISDNRLSGSLPQMLLAKDDILVVDLHGNDFSGHLPSIVEVDDSIEFLALHDNQLTGPIDDRLLSLTKLAHLDLSKNFFTGKMPTSLGMLKSLKYLFLAFNNNFNPGPVPAEYATLPNLVDLSLQKTNRIGTIPYQFEALTEMVLLDLNSNMLTGAIPDEIGGMLSLKFLLLKQNRLSGSLPQSLQNLKALDTLLLDENNFVAGSENICSPVLPLLTTFIADCSEMVACECCTKCCSSAEPSCNEIEWFSDVDPVAEGNYIRDTYLFHETDIEYPAEKQTDSPGYGNNYTGYYQTFDNTVDSISPP